MKNIKNMKKMFKAVLLLLFAPIVMGAVATHQPYQVTSDTGVQSKGSSTVNLDSNSLGFYGPVALGLQYSSLYGYLLKAQYTQLWMQTNAVSLGLEGGKNQRRVNATLAHAFTSQQRVKFSLEHLTQNMDFDFASGNVKNWVGQNAFGLTYEYLIPHSVIHGINVNTFYSKADNKDLTPLPMPDQSLNLRRITGGTDKSASVGVDLNTGKTNQLGLKLNYDKINYNLVNDPNKNKYNDSGFGATVTFDQLLTQRSKLSLLVSHRVLAEDYKAGVHMLVKSAPGTRLEVGLTGERLINGKGLPNDKQIGADVAYAWGGSQHSQQPVYALDTNSATEDLASWTSKPAVYMPQVLAVKDEGFTKSKTASMASVMSYTFDVTPGQDINIDLSKYLQKPANTTADYVVTGDVIGIGKRLQYAKGTLSGHFTTDDVNNKFEVKVSLSASDKMIGTTVPVSLFFSVKNGLTPTPNPNCNPKQVIFYAGEGTTYTWYASDYVQPAALFHDPVTKFGSLVLNMDAINKTLNPLNLNATYTIDKLHEENATLVIQPTGTLQVNTGFDLPIQAQNMYSGGTWSQPQTIHIIINRSTATPTVAIQASTPSYKEGDKQTQITLATANAGTGETFSDTSAITISQSQAGYTLDHFGLVPSVTLTDQSNATVTLKADPQNGVKNFQDIGTSGQVFTITATNTGKKSSAPGKFTLTVLPVSPSVTVTTSSKTFNVGDTASLTIATNANPGAVSESLDATNLTFTPVNSSTPHQLAEFGLTASYSPSPEPGQTSSIQITGTVRLPSGAVSPKSQEFVVSIANTPGNQSFSAIQHFTLTVQNPIRTVTLTCPTSFTIDEHGYGHAQSTDQGGYGVTYTFSNNDAKLPDTNLQFTGSTYYRADHTLQCSYNNQTYGPYQLYVVGGVPDAQYYDVSSFKYINPTGDDICTSTSVNTCMMQYNTK